jgi:hypothetical protein
MALLHDADQDPTRLCSALSLLSLEREIVFKAIITIYVVGVHKEKGEPIFDAGH